MAKAPCPFNLHVGKLIWLILSVILVGLVRPTQGISRRRRPVGGMLAAFEEPTQAEGTLARHWYFTRKMHEPVSSEEVSRIQRAAGFKILGSIQSSIGRLSSLFIHFIFVSAPYADREADYGSNH